MNMRRSTAVAPAALLWIFVAVFCIGCASQTAWTRNVKLERAEQDAPTYRRVINLGAKAAQAMDAPSASFRYGILDADVMNAMVDTKDKSDQLKKNLADLKKKWVDAGKSLKAETVRDVEFTVLPLSSNDVPKTLRNLFPKSSPVEQLGEEKPIQRPPKKDDLVIGQAESLLVVANSLKAAEAVVVRLKGGSVPSLAEFGPYQANHLAMFRDAPAYGWMNVKGFLDVLLPAWSGQRRSRNHLRRRWR